MNNKPDIERKNQVIYLLDDAYAGRINNLKRSKELSQQALSLSIQLNDKALIGRSLNQLALFAMIMGEYNHSMKMSEEAISYFEDLKDEKGIADAKYNLAGIYYKTDNYHLGLVYLVDSLTIYKKFHDYHNQARVQKSIGTIYEYFGDQKNAVKSYKDAIKAARKAGDLNLESNAYNPLSGIYLNQNKIEKALEIIERSMEMKKQTGDIRGLAFALYGRGKIYTKTKQFREAENDFKETLNIHERMGESFGMAMAYYKLGALYIEMGEFEKAKDTLNKALEFSDKYNIVIIKFKCNFLLYEISKQGKKPDIALDYLEKYLSEKEAVINTQTLKVIENYALITKMETMEKDVQVQKEKAEIIEKKNRAEQTSKVKQEFLSSMSHQIRTPLNAVITIASLLEPKSDKEAKHLLGLLKFSANNLLLIINDILDFSKLDSGKVDFETYPCNFKLLLENIKNTYEKFAKEKGLNLLLRIDQGVSDSYELDETKITQILVNLITNAIKFTENGSIAIEIEKINSDEYADLVRFKITDTGIGIPKNNFDEIFESFSQPRSITTRKEGGTGLGLAIVKRLVALHGSIIKVDSTVGKGSVFYFDLKLKRSDSPVKTPVKLSNQLKDKTVLLAEDNMINAGVASKLLTNWGITTEHAKNGLEAIEKSKQRAYDYILMDIHMPEMDGFEATRHIRKYENLNMKTPIFALTADITAEQQKQYVQYFNGLLWKPIEIDKLYEALVNAG